MYKDTFKYHLACAVEHLCAAYFVKARSMHSKAIAAESRTIFGDVVSFDASRVSCTEVLLISVFSHDCLGWLPLQILPDQHRLLTPVSKSMELLDMGARAMAADASASSSTKSPWSQLKKLASASSGTGVAAKAYLVAVLHALFTIFPFASIDPWKPTVAVVPSAQHERRLCDETSVHWYWDPQSGSASWSLPSELVAEGVCGLRVLVLACDEGSQGFLLFQFLAAHPKLRLRVIFHRDPPHRLSGVFVNSLRAVPQIFRSTLDVILVHKFRRAPYGGGRFWSEVKETLALLVLGPRV